MEVRALLRIWVYRIAIGNKRINYWIFRGSVCWTIPYHYHIKVQNVGPKNYDWVSTRLRAATSPRILLDGKGDFPQAIFDLGWSILTFTYLFHGMVRNMRNHPKYAISTHQIRAFLSGFFWSQGTFWWWRCSLSLGDPMASLTGRFRPAGDRLSISEHMGKWW